MVDETANGYFLPNVVPQNVGGAAKHSLELKSIKKSDKCSHCEYASCQKVDLRKRKRHTMGNVMVIFSQMLLMQQTTVCGLTRVSNCHFLSCPLSSPSPSTTLRKIQNSVIVFWWKTNFKMKHRPLLLSENNINSCNQSMQAWQSRHEKQT